MECIESNSYRRLSKKKVISEQIDVKDKIIWPFEMILRLYKIQ